MRNILQLSFLPPSSVKVSLANTTETHPLAARKLSSSTAAQSGQANRQFSNPNEEPNETHGRHLTGKKSKKTSGKNKSKKSKEQSQENLVMCDPLQPTLDAAFASIKADAKAGKLTFKLENGNKIAQVSQNGKQYTYTEFQNGDVELKSSDGSLGFKETDASKTYTINGHSASIPKLNPPSIDDLCNSASGLTVKRLFIGVMSLAAMAMMHV